MPGAGGELAQAAGQAFGGRTLAAQDLGQAVHFQLAGPGEDFRRQLALVTEVAIEAAGGDTDVLGQGLHRQRREAALHHPCMGAGENAAAQFLVTVDSGSGGAVGHDLNPDSLLSVNQDSDFAERGINAANGVVSAKIF
ncbi:hypothetical protein FQZ97_783070 [compost metagenome]